MNQQRALLATRLDNAERLSAFYASKLEKGDANVIETNKIDLELLNTRTEYDLNENAREQKLRELALLNGGVEVAFDDTTYAIADELPDPWLFWNPTTPPPRCPNQRRASGCSLKSRRPAQGRGRRTHP